MTSPSRGLGRGTSARGTSRRPSPKAPPAASRRACVAALLEQSPDPVLRLARDGRVLHLNPSARAALACEVGCAAPADLAALAQQSFATGRIEQADLKRGDRWIWVTARAEGEEASLFGRDVTERRRREERLREREDRCRRLVDLLPDPVLVHQGGRVAFANAAAARLLGATAPESLLGADVSSLVRPEEREAARAGAQGAVAGAGTAWREVRVRRLDGREVVCEVSGAGIEHEGAPAVQVVLRDLSARKDAEAALRESQHKFQALIETNVDFVWETDAQGRYTYCSPQMEKLWGLKPEEAIGKTPFDGMTREHGEAGRRSFALLAEDPKPFRGLESDAFDRQGNLIHVETSGVPFFDEAGRLLGFRGTTRDITAAKRAAEAQREADRQRNEFIAVLSHELRNPLAPIRNSLYVLERAAPGGDQARKAQAVIGRQVDLLTRLVDDLLDATRIARGKVSLERERLDLGRVVRTTVEDHRPEFRTAGVDLDAAITPQALWLDGDATRLAQIVGNLLSNAAKFTLDGGRVRVTLVPERGGAVLRVEDTGLGIAPDQIGAIFEPFAQAEQARGCTRGGLGLGLALVKGFVALHGGTVEAHSDGVGLGATFTVWLPAEAGPSPEIATARVAAAPPRRRVLVIEDDLDAAESLREVLEIQGHDAAIARDGPEGLARAKDLHPDFVLCDIGLPGMDGYAVARAFRAEPDLADVRLVALSGFALPQDLQRAAEAGFERHLAKPPSLERLEALLRSSSAH